MEKDEATSVSYEDLSSNWIGLEAKGEIGLAKECHAKHTSFFLFFFLEVKSFVFLHY